MAPPFTSMEADMAEAKTLKVLVARDYWDADEKRIVTGTEVWVDADDALEGIENGAFKRIPREAK